MLAIEDEIKSLEMGSAGATEEEQKLLNKEIDARVEMTEILAEILKSEFGVESEVYGGRTSKLGDAPKKGSLAERFKNFNVKTFTDLINVAKKAFFTYFSKKNFEK